MPNAKESSRSAEERNEFILKSSKRQIAFLRYAVRQVTDTVLYQSRFKQKAPKKAVSPRQVLPEQLDSQLYLARVVGTRRTYSRFYNRPEGCIRRVVIKCLVRQIERVQSIKHLRPELKLISFRDRRRLVQRDIHQSEPLIPDIRLPVRRIARRIARRNNPVRAGAVRVLAVLQHRRCPVGIPLRHACGQALHARLLPVDIQRCILHINDVRGQVPRSTGLPLHNGRFLPPAEQFPHKFRATIGARNLRYRAEGKVMRYVVSRRSFLHHKFLRIEKPRPLNRLGKRIVCTEGRPPIANRIAGLHRVVPTPPVVAVGFRNLAELGKRGGQRRQGKGRHFLVVADGQGAR